MKGNGFCVWGIPNDEVPLRQVRLRSNQNESLASRSHTGYGASVRGRMRRGERGEKTQPLCNRVF